MTSTETRGTGTRGAWTRGLGISLVRTEASSILEAPALARALADGIAHGYDGPLHEYPDDAEWYVIREARPAGGIDVGVAVLVPRWPAPHEAALFAVAIAPEHRGRATASKALLVIERRLRREGIARLLARVPRTNGRGLYFMLRVGYTPVPPSDTPPGEDGDVTWFARGGRN